MQNKLMIPIMLTLNGVIRFPKYVGQQAWKIPFKKQRGRNQGYVSVLINGNNHPINFNREFWKAI